MADLLNNFELPRTDWVDEQGRIYKDALIENFNAIEDKLQEMQQLDIMNITLPDVSNISLDDVTLDSPDNKIINLRSFLNIMKIEDYPIDLEFNGTKLVNLGYWHGKEFKTITDIETNANDTNKYVIFNPNSRAVYSRTAPEGNGTMVIAFCTGGQVRPIYSGLILGVNLLQALAKMPVAPYSATCTNGRNYGSPNMLWDSKESKAGNYNVTMARMGWEYSK